MHGEHHLGNFVMGFDAMRSATLDALSVSVPPLMAILPAPEMFPEIVLLPVLLSSSRWPFVFRFAAESPPDPVSQYCGAPSRRLAVNVCWSAS